MSPTPPNAVCPECGADLFGSEYCACGWDSRTPDPVEHGPRFTSVSGDGPVLDMFQDAAKQVLAGKVNAAAVILCTRNGEIWLNTGVSDDAVHPWAIMVAGAASLQQELLVNGL